MKFTHIIIGKKNIKINQLIDKEKGIKFLLTEELSHYFYLEFNKTLRMEKLVIGNDKNNITLFNCFYTIRNTYDGHLYVHLIYNEFVNCIVESRNFVADKVQISLNAEKIEQFKFDNISFMYKNYTIQYKITTKTIDIIISSNIKVRRFDLFNIFVYNFELLNIILGFFPTISKTVYFNDKNKMTIKQKYVDKYITDEEYIKKDLCFFDKIDTSLMESCFEKYILFSSSNRKHIDIYFTSLMKKSSYIDVRVANILHSFDGIFNKLKMYSNQVCEYSEKMNAEIIERLKGTDIEDIKIKYNSNVDIKAKIDNLLKRAYLFGFRSKLKKLFSFDNYIVFNQEKINRQPININFLIDKCVNTRNELSHADENEQLEYLTPIECTSYFLKLILLYRLLIMNEIDIYDRVNKNLLKNHLDNVDGYIRRILKEDISNVIFKHIGMRKFNMDNFEPVENNNNKNCKYKPCNGGYWASPENSSNNWELTQKLDDSCKTHCCRFKIRDDARVKYIFEREDLQHIPHIDNNNLKIIDFEKTSDIYDAIYYYPNEEELLTLLPSWDCECILVLNPSVMEIIENI